ncbi:minor capsid protein [Aerococcaceae bacterium NML190073]|nr:minor capsid protein [Aerococcaceae bacterium NML190073]
MIVFRIAKADMSALIRHIEQRTKVAQKAFAPMFIESATPYVPMKSGKLRASGHSENGGKHAVWQANNRGYPYGLRWFYQRARKWTTAGTTNRWDLKAIGLHLGHWESELKKFY